MWPGTLGDCLVPAPLPDSSSGHWTQARSPTPRRATARAAEKSSCPGQGTWEVPEWGGHFPMLSTSARNFLK